MLNRLKIRVIFTKGTFDFDSRDNPVQTITDDSNEFGLSNL
jgi:hypothetical protein